MVVKCQEVPVFHPTLRDVNGSWEAYIESIERRFAHVGLAKIVPPKGWTPRKAGYSEDFDFDIPRPIRQAQDMHASLLAPHCAGFRARALISRLMQGLNALRLSKAGPLSMF
jgi:hypothetical protein